MKDELKNYIKKFKKWYVFWLEDQLFREVEYVVKYVSNNSLLYHLVFARSLYDGLCIATQFRAYPDVLVLDIDLSHGDEKLESFDRTNPFQEEGAHIYIGDSDIKSSEKILKDLSQNNYIWAFDKLNDLPDDVLEKGGIYVWATFLNNNKGYYTNDNVVIYTGYDNIKKEYRILEYAGLLTIRTKEEILGKEVLEKSKNLETLKISVEYAKRYRAFYNKFYTKHPEDEKLNCETFLMDGGNWKKCQQKIRPKQLWNKEGDGGEVEFIVENFEIYGDRAELKIRNFDSKEIVETIKVGTIKEEPPFSRMVKNLIKKKIDKAEEVDPFILQELLSGRGEWKIEIGGNSSISVPFYLAPLKGRIDIPNRTISLSSQEKPQINYLLATFLLPWSDRLMNEDNTVVDDIISEIEDLCKKGSDIVREFALFSQFHDFIEDSIKTSTIDRSMEMRIDQIIKEISEPKFKRVFLQDTIEEIKNYLTEKNFSENRYEKIRARVKIYLEDLRNKFEEWKKNSDPNWDVNIFIDNKIEVSRHRIYIDVFWLEELLKVIFDNLTPLVAFKGLHNVPKITFEIFLETTKGWKISVKDNGVGIQDVEGLTKIRNGGLYSFLERGGKQLLKNYGELTIESNRKKIEMLSKCSTFSDVEIGTKYTLHIFTSFTDS